MPLAQTVLRVFVSSPRDVAAERCAVVEAMKELNRTWSAHLGLRLEPILWEADCRPSVSTDPQQAINEQIPPDYDVFLGILWTRFGTKTPRFGSGTEEEFETAYLRQRKRPEAVSVLVYFKDEPIPPSRVDPEQLRSLVAFKKRLGPKGVLYWQFQTSDDFRQLARIHLSREMQQWVSRTCASGRQKSPGLRKRTSHNQIAGVKVSLAELKQQTVTKLQKLAKTFASLVKIDNARESSLRKLIQMVEARQDWTRRDSKQVAHALASSAKSMNARLALVARDFVGLVDEAVDAFVDFFVFMLLSETVSLKDAKSGLNLFRKFSRSLTNKAKQYWKKIPARPTVWLRRYTALLAAQKSLAVTLRGFAPGLETGANVMLAGERVVRLFLSRKFKSKTIEL